MSYPIQENYEINHEKFKQKLKEELGLLQQWFEEESFTQNNVQLGSEVEYFLIDENMNLSCKSDEIIKLTPDNVVQEIDNCFLECNTKPVNISSDALQKILAHLEEDYRLSSLAADKFNSKLLSIGNCPTAMIKDFERNTASNSTRYQLLQKYMWPYKEPFHVSLSEKDGIELQCRNFSQLSASFQIHMRVGFQQSVQCYNAAVALAGPILAACTNAPILCGKQYWMESRIILLEKLFSTVTPKNPTIQGRLSFPNRYIDKSWLEVFSDIGENLPALFPIVFDEQHNPIQHFQLHNGSNYPWVRNIVDFNHEKRPHLRIEFRPLSSGPSNIDMVANIAFFSGLVNAFATKELALIPIEHAHKNFYAAAEFGLAASMLWNENKSINASDLIINQLLPLAKEGLENLSLSQEDIDYYLNIIDQRVRKKQTGSHWQINFLQKNNGDLQKLVRRYLELQNSGVPVHEWEN